jgi:WD40 repeat protein
MFKPSNTYQISFASDSIFETYVHDKLVTFSSSVPDIKILSFPDLKFLGTLKGHTKFTTDMKFSKDGKLLMSTSEDGTIKIWDLVSMKNVASMNAGIGEVFCVEIFDNLLSSGGEQDIILAFERVIIHF